MTEVLTALLSGGAEEKRRFDPTQLSEMADASKLCASQPTNWKHPERAFLPEFQAKPLRTQAQTVPSRWIDYNGHMNLAYYMMAYIGSAEMIYDDILLIGAEYARTQGMGACNVQEHVNHCGELLEGDRFCIGWRILEHDEKRLHTWADLVRVSDGMVAATFETIVLNVDLKSRRVVPFPAWAQARIGAMADAHALIPAPVRMGASIGLRKEGRSD